MLLSLTCLRVGGSYSEHVHQTDMAERTAKVRDAGSVVVESLILSLFLRESLMIFLISLASYQSLHTD